MAKLGKQKFNLLGSYIPERTINKGDIEMHLYYNTENDYFYFEDSDLKKYINEDILHPDIFFKECNTKDKAVNKVQTLFKVEAIETKMLKVMLGIPSRLYKEQLNLPPYLVQMLYAGSLYNKGIISLDYEKVMRLEINGSTYYVKCNSDWKYDRRCINEDSKGLIEWTESVEKFLVDTQNKIDELCLTVLESFNAGETVEQLLEKIKSDQN